MKIELSKIAKDLEQGTITDNEARNFLLGLLGVSNSLEQTIYVTNSSPNDVYAAFDSQNRSKIDSEESGCYVTEITLYKGKRF